MPADDPHLRGQLEAFGRQLREIRTEAGMTQEQLAIEAGTDRSYLVEIEQGRHSPGLELIFRIARALGRDASDLFAGL